MLSFRAVSIIIMAGFTAMDIACPKHIFYRGVFKPIFFFPLFFVSSLSALVATFFFYQKVRENWFVTLGYDHGEFVKPNGNIGQAQSSGINLAETNTVDRICMTQRLVI